MLQAVQKCFEVHFLSGVAYLSSMSCWFWLRMQPRQCSIIDSDIGVVDMLTGIVGMRHVWRWGAWETCPCAPQVSLRILGVLVYSRC